MRYHGKKQLLVCAAAAALIFLTGCGRAQVENLCKSACASIGPDAKNAVHATTTEYIRSDTEQRELMQQEIWYRSDDRWAYRVQEGSEADWYVCTNEDALEKHPGTLWRDSEKDWTPEKHRTMLDWNNEKVRFISANREDGLQAVSWKQQANINGVDYEPVCTFFFDPQEQLVRLQAVVDISPQKDATVEWVKEIEYWSFDSVAVDHAIAGFYHTAIENKEPAVTEQPDDWMKDLEGYQTEQIPFDGRVASAVAADEEIKPFTLRLLLPEGWTWKAANWTQKKRTFPAEDTALDDAEKPYFVTCGEWMEPVALYDVSGAYAGVLAYTPMELGKDVIPPHADLPEGQQAYVDAPDMEQPQSSEISGCANGVQTFVTHGIYRRTTAENQLEQRTTKAILAENTNAQLALTVELADTAVTDKQLQIIGRSLFCE